MNKQELINKVTERKYIRPNASGLLSVEYKRAFNDACDEFVSFVEQIDEPQITDEQAWNKIAEAYPETDQSLRITLDHAVFGHMNKEKKIPQIIAKYLELCKTDNFDFTEDYNLVSYDFINHFDTDLTIEEMEEIKMWFYDNDQKENQRRHILFLQAYTDGYEVEKPKYYVELPFEEWDEDAAELNAKSIYLGFDITTDETRYMATKKGWGDFKTKLDEETIKSIDERYWPFAVPVEKV